MFSLFKLNLVKKFSYVPRVCHWGKLGGKALQLVAGGLGWGQTPKGRRIVNEASVQVQSKNYVNSRNIAKLFKLILVKKENLAKFFKLNLVKKV